MSKVTSERFPVEDGQGGLSLLVPDGVGMFLALLAIRCLGFAFGSEHSPSRAPCKGGLQLHLPHPLSTVPMTLSRHCLLLRTSASGQSHLMVSSSWGGGRGITGQFFPLHPVKCPGRLLLLPLIRLCVRGVNKNHIWLSASRRLHLPSKFIGLNS